MLFDILQSIRSIYLPGFETIEEFSSDLKTIRSVERELAIIGEAAHQLQKDGFRFTGQDQLINRRHTLIHQYYAARPQNLWNFITYKLPPVEREVLALMN